MGSPSALSVLRVPGVVAFNGAELGLVAQVQVRRFGAQTPIVAEEWGVEVVESVYVGASYRLGLALRGWDASAIAAIFPNAAGGSVVYPGTKKAGYHRSADAGSLVFVPRDSNHPGLEMPGAIPETAEDLEVDLARRTEHLILCSFLFNREAGALSWGV